MLSLRSIGKLVTNALFAIHILLLFLILFESKLDIPSWIQPLGRMHPLILHFPIGLLVMVGLMQLIKKEVENDSFQKLQRFTLYIASLSTAVAALMGLFLSQESGYASSLMDLHKWTGLGLSFLVYGLLLAHESPKLPRLSFNLGLIASLVLMVFAGHFGASLTHGEDFVWAPLQSKEAPAITEETPLYEAAILPVLEQKCFKCHNDKKSKGELNMSTRVALLEGGENGPIWEAGNADESQVIHRARLPLEDEEHMPPEGKPQLTEAEIDLLHAWIASGADLDLAIKEYPAEGSVRNLAAALLPKDGEAGGKEAYAFSFASEKELTKLNTPYRSVRAIAAQSPALHAQLFVRQAFTQNSLQELGTVKEQLVELNLSNMPIKDEDMAFLGGFTNLEQLFLNETEITGVTLSELASCQQLSRLSLSSTSAGPEIAAALAKLPALEQVFLWNTQVKPEDLPDMEEQLPGVELSLGYIPQSNERLPLGPPTVQSGGSVIEKGETVKLKHSFPGVSIHFTTDGSEPDSLSPRYEAPISLEGFTTLKSKVYLDGWLSSKVEESVFFYRSTKAQDVQLLKEPHKQYQANGASSLQDGEKGDADNFGSGSWLGFKETAMEALLDLGTDKPEISHLTVSYLQSMGDYIMPPRWIEVWAGNSPSSLKRVKRETLPAPTEEGSNKIGAVDVEIPSGYRYLKVIAEPIRRLPSWHRGAGDKAWVFVDELFLY